MVRQVEQTEIKAKQEKETFVDKELKEQGLLSQR